MLTGTCSGRIRDFHPLWSAFPGRCAGNGFVKPLSASATPGRIPVWAMSAFARRYLRNQCLFLFLQVLRCFSSLRSLYLPYAFRQESPLRVGFPHSDIAGSTLVCQIPGAYRRLPRPSSLLDAKTSTVHPW